MNDFTTNGVQAPQVTYQTIISGIRAMIDEKELDVRRMNHLLLNLVNEIRSSPVKEEIILRELKDIDFTLSGNKDDDYTACHRSLSNYITQFDPDYVMGYGENGEIYNVPAKTKQAGMSSLDREIELATAEGDMEEVEYLMKKKIEAMKEANPDMEIPAEVDLKAPKQPNSSLEPDSNANYNLNGLNLSKDALKALNKDAGVTIVDNTPKLNLETPVPEVKTEDWNNLTGYNFPDEDYEKKLMEEVSKDLPKEEPKPEVKKEPEVDPVELRRNQLLAELASLDRKEVPVSEPVLEKSTEETWNNINNTKKEEIVETPVKLEVETEYKEINTEVENVKADIMPVEEFSPVEVIDDDGKTIANIKHEVMPVEEFDNIVRPLSKVPSESLLKEFRGDRLSKIKAYRDAHKSGRKIYLPDSGYEVFIYKMRDRQQINYMFMLLEQAGFGADLTQRYEIDELVRVVSEHIDFDFPTVPDRQEFLFNVSPRDFSLLVMMFALINSPEFNDKEHAVAKIDRCSCANCGTKVFFKEDVNLDLVETFTKTYPFDRFLQGYNKYTNAKPADIVLAYRKPGSYGELHKTEADDDLFEYKLVFSKPTVGKIQNRDKNVEDIYYKFLIKNFIDKRETLEDEVPYLSVVDSIIGQCPDWISYREYAKNFLDMYRENPDDPDYGPIQNALTYLSDQLDIIEDNNTGIMNLCTWIDMFIIKSKDGTLEPEKFEHDDLFELFCAILTAPTEIITECLSVIDSIKDLDGINDNVIELDSKFAKEHIDFDKTYYTDDEALQKFDTNNPDASEERRNKFIEDRKVMRERTEKGTCPICSKDKFNILYPQLLFFSMASRLRPKEKI